MVIAVVGVFATFSAWFYTQYFLLRPIGTGPAGPILDKNVFATEWSQSAVSLVGLGDSITAGLGAASTDHTFFNRLLKNPHDEFPDMQGICLSRVLPNIEAENLAISGSTSSEHLRTIEERLQPRSPDVFGIIVMTTGGNDLIHSYGGYRLENALCMVRRSIKPNLGSRPFEPVSIVCMPLSSSVSGGCEIFIADIYDPTDGVGDAPSVYLPHWEDGLRIHSQYNQAIYQFAESHPNVHVVPLHKTFLDGIVANFSAIVRRSSSLPDICTLIKSSR